jgi:hypothetical protein
MNPTDERHAATSPTTLLSHPETNSVQEAQRKQGIKFALFTRNTRREQGGEYTFESEILRAWLNAPSHHETTICSLGKVLPFDLDLNGAQQISLIFRSSTHPNEVRSRVQAAAGTRAPTPANSQTIT